MTDLIVAKVDAARALLLQARDAVDAKKVMDLGKAAKVYAERQKLGKQSIQYANGVIVDSQRLLGQFLKMGERATPSESADSQFVAKLAEEAPEEFEALKADQKSLSEIKRELKKREVHANLPALPSDKFRVLYADPPWHYGNSGVKH